MLSLIVRVGFTIPGWAAQVSDEITAHQPNGRITSLTGQAAKCKAS